MNREYLKNRWRRAHLKHDNWHANPKPRSRAPRAKAKSPDPKDDAPNALRKALHAGSREAPPVTLPKIVLKEPDWE